MQNAPLDGSYKLRALKLSTIAIASVVLVELVLGLLVNSLAIVSDGLHAMLDALTTLVLFFATRASLKPPDEEHTYGHEKFESMGGLMGGVVLSGVALLIMYEAVLKILMRATISEEFQFAGFIAIGYTFAIDFFRVSTFLKARKTESTTFRAGFLHAIADLSSTIIAFLGFGLATLGVWWGDPIASMILSVLLTYLSVRLLWGSAMELSDMVPGDVVEKTRDMILGVKGVYRCENLRVRKAGDKLFVEATVLVPAYMSLEEAHNLATTIESNLKAALGNADVTIHIEPVQEQKQTDRLMEKLATEVEGVEDAHEINAVFTGGKLYVTLHARVNPRLPVDEAHRIAGEIERKITEKIKDVGNVTVHIEPCDGNIKRDTGVNEAEVRQAVNEMTKHLGEAFKIKRVMTYEAANKRYINVDCCFTKRVSVEEAHEIASKIEGNIKRLFAEAAVTVHMEPS